MSAGIRSGVNWMRWNFRWKIWAIERTSSVLARPGRAGDQAVPAGEQADQQLLDDVGLADDDLRQLARRCAARLAANLLDDLLFQFDRSSSSVAHVSDPCQLQWSDWQLSLELLTRSAQCVIAYVTMLIPSGYDFFSENSWKYPGSIAFALPAVAEVGVVADDDHHPALVVEDALVVRRSGRVPALRGAAAVHQA